MTTAPKRRWFRFTLRTLFVVVTVFGIWLGYELNWIRQRHAVLSGPHVVSYVSGVNGVSPVQALAPWSLRLFGERGAYLVFLAFVDDERASHCASPIENDERLGQLNSIELFELERVTQLFPEASVVTGGVFSHAEALENPPAPVSSPAPTPPTAGT
jgi:hypothetical protein